jgi:hypothetical protein
VIFIPPIVYKNHIPFHTISNPYFIELLQQLRPAYHPPSRQLLSGSLLNLEIVKINQKLYSLMEKATNLTLGNIFYICNKQIFLLIFTI